jgi:hypothetical protein
MSSKYRLRFCKADGGFELIYDAQPPLVIVRTLCSEDFLLPLIGSLFALSTRLLNRIAQVDRFCTKVYRIINFLLNRGTFADNSKDIWERKN